MFHSECGHVSDLLKQGTIIGVMRIHDSRQDTQPCSHFRFGNQDPLVGVRCWMSARRRRSVCGMA